MTAISSNRRFGGPVSTTHDISASIMGVAAAKRLGTVTGIVVEQMLWAWVLTLPCAAAVSYLVGIIFRS